jgi:hypothetical protein
LVLKNLYSACSKSIINTALQLIKKFLSFETPPPGQIGSFRSQGPYSQHFNFLATYECANNLECLSFVHLLSLV